MKILWITEHFPPNRGGMSESCDRITRGLRAEGVEIDLLHLRPPQASFKTRQQVNGRYLARPLDSDTGHSLNLIWNELQSEDYTHVVAFGGLLTMQSGSVFAAWLQASLLTLFRGNDFDSGIFSLKASPILHETLRRSRAACVVDADKQAKLQALYPQLDTYHTPNGIDSKIWQTSPSDIAKAKLLRAELLGEAKQVWGLFGQIKAKKGGLFLLKNLLKLKVENQVHLLVTDELGPKLETFLSEQGDRFHITRLPFLDRFELIPYYLSCDFVALPSFYDGMPNVMMEAGLLGVPLLMSDAGGIKDWLQDEKHGFQFHAGNPDQCRHAIQRALDSSPEQRAAMSHRIRETIRTELPASMEISRYLEILAATLPAKAASAPVALYPKSQAASS